MRYHRHQVELVDSPTNLVSQFRQSLAPKRPWDSIVDFATHRSFCGFRLYPRQQTLLKLIYLETETMTPYDIDVIEGWRTGFQRSEPEGVQPDVWERVDYLKRNGYTHFPHVQAVLGRRASKGMVGGILGAERMAYMVSLSDPQSYYGIDQNKDLYLTVLATNSFQAKRFQFADIKVAVEQNKWLTEKISSNKDHYISLRTDGDVRKIAEHQKRGLEIDSEFATIRAVPMSPTSSSGRGAAGFAMFYDEFAFLITNPDSSKSSEEVYCLAPETPVTMSDGSVKTIGEVQVGDSVLSTQEDRPESLVQTEVVNKWEFSHDEYYEIELEDGSVIRCSPNHMWYTQRGWVRTDELLESDEILEERSLL